MVSGKPELLAPAGNLEKLKIAVIYGADAVYCGGYNFGLRWGADNFSLKELKEGTRFVHNNNAQIYITVNMMPHNEDFEGLPEYLNNLEKIGVDALIVSDPGVIRVINKENINIPLHLSTQANTVNINSVLFWEEQGLARIILARELSQKEITQINEDTDISLEMFIHGSMCISYSGRCLLSNYMTNRDANRGKCAHSCRWKYYLMEEERPENYYPVFEDKHGSYILNSRDLCLIEYIPEIVKTGVDSLKIEGRMKGLHYVAAVTKIYRQALDEYFQDPDKYVYQKKWKTELKKISHRGYTTGFFQGVPDETDHNYEDSAYKRTYDFMGVVRNYLPENKTAEVEVREKFFKGDRIEVLGPDIEPFTTTVDFIINEEGKYVEDAPHPKEIIKIPVSKKVKPYYMIRRKR
ncbi:MAG: peptidase U32 family protein [Bacillota bacterium]